MRRAAEKRAARYREQAVQLRKMAECERDANLRADLLDLADESHELANRIEIGLAHARSRAGASG
jgi:hypothetical protein